MIYETVDLYRHFRQYASPSEGAGTLTCYRTSVGEIRLKLRPAVLVLPGGGYEFLSAREKEPIALKFLAAGFNVYVLAYSLAPVSYPAQLREAAMAIAYIRECAEEHGTDDERVAAIGFSAGGHLCGAIGTCFDDECVKALFPRAEACRPDAIVLSYPVVSSDPLIAHAGSFDNFCAKDPALRRKFSLEKRVTARSSPAFLWHTADDDCVPVGNSLRLAAAYSAAGVPFELHVFERGAHGGSLFTDEVYDDGDVRISEHNANWLSLALDWLRLRGFRARTV